MIGWTIPRMAVKVAATGLKSLDAKQISCFIGDAQRGAGIIYLSSNNNEVHSASSPVWRQARGNDSAVSSSPI